MSIKSFNSFNEAKGEKWIQDAIKNPGALKKSMGKKEGEKISKSEINAELAKLKAKDKDPNKPGAQLGKKDATKKRRLELAKTLSSLKENCGETSNYMFFGNLKTIKRLVDEMLEMDEAKVDAMLSDGHNWAVDHIATSKDDVEEVFNFLAGHDSLEDNFGHEHEHEHEIEEFGNEEAEEEFTSQEPINQEQGESEETRGVKSFQDFQS
jgi:hypothetical protein